MQAHVDQGSYIPKVFAVTDFAKQGCVLAQTLFSLYLTAMLKAAFDGVARGTVSSSKLVLMLTCLTYPFSKQKHAQPRS